MTITRTITTIAATGALALSGCGSDNTTTEPEFIVAGADSVFPYETIGDVVTYADTAAVITVIDERFGPPEGGEEPYIPRFVTVQIDTTLWTAEQGPRLGDTVELVTWGSDGGREPARPIIPHGEVMLEVGRTYAAALINTFNEWSTYPRAVRTVEADGTLHHDHVGEGHHTGEGPFADYVSVDVLTSALLSAEPDPRADQFAELDPFDQALSVAKID